MINYADEAYYKSAYLAGRQVAITTAFAYYAREATMEIKRYTGTSIDEENIPESAQMCCCEVAELVYNYTLQQSGISSESVGGWSKSYESTEQRKASYKQSIHDVVYKWLSGTGLLYRGVR